MAGSDNDDIRIRELEARDISRGFLATLNALSPAIDIDPNRTRKIFKDIKSNQNHIIVIAETDGQIVGTATLLIEPKFIHDGGMAGHIEDVAVRDGFRGCGIGRMLVKYLLRIAGDRGCYKTVLDCTEDVRPFYERLGLRQASCQMRADHS